ASRANRPSDTFGMLTPKLAGVVSLAGVSDLLELDKGHRSAKQKTPITEFVGTNPAEAPDIVKRVSPIELLPLGVEQVLVHGDMDINVPIGASYLYNNKASTVGDKTRLKTVPLADHFTLVDPATPYWREVVEAIDTLEKR